MLVIIPCGRAKIWKACPWAGPTPAKDAYVGAPFKVNREFAEASGARWLILSAKYGFLDPDTRIEDYNKAFTIPSSDPIGMSELRRQVREMGLASYGSVVALGGSEYSSRVSAAFEGTGVKVSAPTAGLPIGLAMRRVKELTPRVRSSK
ncbi:MAG: hypothetical protein Q8P50_12285 [Bacillota bacterium]|nr:hypothetical protein [Bacillota bacterium]